MKVYLRILISRRDKEGFITPSKNYYGKHAQILFLSEGLFIFIKYVTSFRQNNDSTISDATTRIYVDG